MMDRSQQEWSRVMGLHPIEAAVRRLLAESSHYALRTSEIRFAFAGGVLTLEGNVPSFYAKQLLQSQLKRIDGVDRIQNLVSVADPDTPDEAA